MEAKTPARTSIHEVGVKSRAQCADGVPWREDMANGHIFLVKTNFWALECVAVDRGQSRDY